MIYLRLPGGNCEARTMCFVLCVAPSARCAMDVFTPEAYPKPSFYIESLTRCRDCPSMFDCRSDFKQRPFCVDAGSAITIFILESLY